MNRSFSVAVLTVTMIIMMSTVSYALRDPHNFSCDNCHGKFPAATAANTAMQSATMCIGCHNTAAQATRMPINSDAMSNYFGAVAGQPAKGSRSSHTWNVLASYQSYSTGFVREAQTINLNYGYNEAPLNRSVSCIRCHDAKEYNGVKYTGSTNSNLGVDKPFLRTTNVNDAMCLDCHFARQSSTQASGTHPANYRSYSAAYKSNTTAYRRTPLNANPNNRTSQLANYFSKNGRIVCSTCHGTHKADSSSATLDNWSTANGFAQDDPAKGLKGQMQESKGQLLRTDPIGASSNAINVCSSCHKETAQINHNGSGQNVQCDHCHGAHVDFTGDGSAYNVNLVRRDFSNMSTNKIKLAANKKVIYNRVAYDSATTLRFVRADDKGICQVCHTSIHSIASGTRKGNCLTCHKHSNGFSAVDCTTCHGQPPLSNLVGGPNGKSSQDYALDESNTPHATHASSAYYNYACKNCHYDGTRADSHNTATKTFASVFVDTAGSVGANAGYPNITSHYSKGSRTCSSIYCHSNGNPRGGSIQWKDGSTPSWENGKNMILGTTSECITCHESGSTLITNAHSGHVTTNDIKCYVCHSDTVNSSQGIVNRSKHANGSKDVVFVNKPENYLSIFSASFNSEAATCANSCHTDGLGGAPARTPLWTEAPINKGAAYCGSCHGAVPTTTMHTMHFTGAVGPKLGATPDCSACHAYPAGTVSHVNGKVDLINGGTSCAPCHPATTSTPNWYNPAIICESCHTGTTASVVTNESGIHTASLKSLNGHSQYSSAALKHVKCTTCHSSTADHIGAGVAQKRLKLSGNAVCNDCHLTSAFKGLSTAKADLLVHGAAASPPPATNAFAHYTTTNDGRANECSGCHDTHGTSNLSNIRTVINGQTIQYINKSTGFYVLTANNGIYNGLCQVCHTKTKFFRNNVDPTLSLSHAAGDCLNCHLHKSTATKTVMFAFQPVDGGCGGCHGYPPVRSEAGLKVIGNYSSAKFQDYSGGGGAHTVEGHLLKTITQSGSWDKCTNCHYGNTAKHNQGGTPITFAKRAFVNVIVNPKFKFRNDTSITYNYNASSCSNVSCHFKPSPNWTNNGQ